MSTFFRFFSKKIFFLRPVENQELARGCNAENGEKRGFSTIMGGTRDEKAEYGYKEQITS
jgi:hypothetical protein